MPPILNSYAPEGCIPKFKSAATSQQPPLVASVTEDEAEDKIASLIPTQYDANEFLRLYENMIREQEKDYSATIAHLQPILELLELAGHGRGASADAKFSMTGGIQYSTLKRARETAEQKYGFIKKDLQWKMVMNTLTNQDVRGDAFISWTEIVHCYRACILGMQTLQYTPSAGETRNRARERSMSGVLTFQPQTAEKQKRTISTRVRCKPNWKLSILVYLIPAFLLGTSIMFCAARLIQSTTPKPAKIPLFANQKLDESAVLIIIPGPHLPPHPVVDIVPLPMLSSSKAVPASIIQREPPPASAPFTKKGLAGTSGSQPNLPLSFRDMQSSTLSSQTIKLNCSDFLNRLDISSIADRQILIAGTRKPRLLGGSLLVGILAPALVYSLSIATSSMFIFVPIGLTVVAGTLVANSFNDLF